MATKQFCDICGEETSRVCSSKAEEAMMCSESSVYIKGKDHVFEDGTVFGRSIYIGVAARNKKYGDTDICMNCAEQALQLIAAERAFYAGCSECSEFSDTAALGTGPHGSIPSEKYAEICGSCKNPGRQTMIDLNNDAKFRFKSSAFKYSSALKFENKTEAI